MSVHVDIAHRDDMHAFATRLAALLRAGDLLILTGNLGAGKTTFTQFIATALDVTGRVSSPTFVIAREHPPAGDGPGLVHVDAYRLDGAAELEDLDLDSELDEVITIVEWGRGMAETLADDYLDVVIDRPAADPESERRTVTLTGHGTGWDERLAELEAAP